VAAQDKVAFITGRTRNWPGDGPWARQLGIAVVIGSRDEANGRAAAEKLRSEGIEKLESVRFDVTAGGSSGDCPASRGALCKLDILVNNAGSCWMRSRWRKEGQHYVHGDVRSPPQDVRDELLRRCGLTQALLPLIRKSPAGRIVNLSSVLGSLTLHSDPSRPSIP